MMDQPARRPTRWGGSLAFVLFLGAVAAPAGAATYHVSRSEGDDGWTGEVATPDGPRGPWKTLGRASSAKLAPGDRLLLKCGDTWNEELHPQGSGTPSNFIVIGSYGEFVAPIVGRTTRKARLLILRTAAGDPAIAEFEAYRDTTGWLPVTASGQPGK